MNMRISATLVLLLSMLPAQVQAAPDDKSNPPQGTFTEGWMSVFLERQKIGYAHTKQTRRDNNIHTDTSTYLLIKRGGMPIEVKMRDQAVETVTGAPVSFDSDVHIAEQPMKMSGQIADGMVTVAGEQYGQKLVQTVPYPDGALMPWGIFLESIRHAPEPGTKFSMNTYVPIQALNVGVPVSVEVLAKETISLFGEEVEAFKTRTTTTMNGTEVEAIGWINGDWEPLKQELKLMGLAFEMVACDREQALAGIGGAEMFVNTLIPVGRSIDRDRVRSITYKISATAGTKMPEFPETEMQKIISKTPEEVVLKVSRIDHAALKNCAPEDIPDELDPYLQPSMFVTSTDREVVALAHATAGTETNTYVLADLLRKKVSAVVQYKDLGTAFATAAEVCRNKTGDCTENGVLLAALGRALGIPTRVVTGLLYVPRFQGREDVMGFHMWTQFWINGRWIDLDSAWDQTDVDPTHLALGTHSTEHSSIANLVSGVMLQLDHYNISILEVEPEK